MSKIIKVELSNRTEQEILLDNVVKIIHFFGNAIELSDPEEINSGEDFRNNKKFIVVMEDGKEYHCVSASRIFDEQEIHAQEDAEYHCRVALKHIRNGDFMRAINNIQVSQDMLNKTINWHE